jgi:hypothetical protein
MSRNETKRNNTTRYDTRIDTARHDTTHERIDTTRHDTTKKNGTTQTTRTEKRSRTTVLSLGRERIRVRAPMKDFLREREEGTRSHKDREEEREQCVDVVGSKEGDGLMLHRTSLL